MAVPALFGDVAGWSAEPPLSQIPANGAVAVISRRYAGNDGTVDVSFLGGAAAVTPEILTPQAFQTPEGAVRVERIGGFPAILTTAPATPRKPRQANLVVWLNNARTGGRVLAFSANGLDEDALLKFAADFNWRNFASADLKS